MPTRAASILGRRGARGSQWITFDCCATTLRPARRVLVGVIAAAGEDVAGEVPDRADADGVKQVDVDVQQLVDERRLRGVGVVAQLYDVEQAAGARGADQVLRDDERQ